MPRGRKPVPTALHTLRGTLNVTRHRNRATEPKAEGELSDAPSWLSPEQAEGWAYAIEHAPRGMLAMIDRSALLVFVEAEDRHRRAMIQQTKLDTDSQLPLLTKGRLGVPIISPYLTIISRASATMLAAASELGFTPVSRPRLAKQVGEVAEKTSAWSRLKVIKGGKG